MSSHPATLIVRGLNVAAGPRPLLGGVDLVVAPGDRLGLVGPNGSGKSTFLQTLAGLRPPEGGEVRVAPPAATVGYLPQEARPQPGETVRGLLARRTGVAGAAASLDAATGAVAGGEPASLSPGERTRATLAALQARGVNLLVLDEPTNHLDLPAIEQLEQALQHYAGTLILVTHDRRLLDAVGIDRVVDVIDGVVSERR